MGRNNRIEWLLSYKNYSSKECLEWPFSTNWDGYGRIRFDGMDMNTHRVMCIIAHGHPSETSLQASHKCGNTTCVNPTHLYWATPSQNQKDIAKHIGKTSRRKLSSVDAKVIKLMSKSGVSQKTISEKFNISPRMVRLIKNGECWVDV